jgi:hemerythrin superfamily protein
MRDESIYDLLKADHRTVREIFEQMESTGGQVTRERLVGRLKLELLAHAEAEDTVFYKPLGLANEARDVILEAEEEHRVVARLLGELERMSAEDEKWKARVTVLKELVEHHVNEEEGAVFRKAKGIFDAEIEAELGAAFLAEKRRLQAEMRAA